MSSNNHSLGRLVSVTLPNGSGWSTQLAELLDEPTPLQQGGFITDVWLLQSDRLLEWVTEAPPAVLSHLRQGLMGLTLQVVTDDVSRSDFVGRVSTEEYDHSSGKFLLWLQNDVGQVVSASSDEVRWPLPELTGVKFFVRVVSSKTKRVRWPCVGYLGSVIVSDALHFCVHDYLRRQTHFLDPGDVKLVLLSSFGVHHGLVGMPVEYEAQMGWVEQLTRYGGEVGARVRLRGSGRLTDNVSLQNMSWFAPRPSHQLF